MNVPTAEQNRRKKVLPFIPLAPCSVARQQRNIGYILGGVVQRVLVEFDPVELPDTREWRAVLLHVRRIVRRSAYRNRSGYL